MYFILLKKYIYSMKFTKNHNKIKYFNNKIEIDLINFKIFIPDIGLYVNR